MRATTVTAFRLLDRPFSTHSGSQNGQMRRPEAVAGLLPADGEWWLTSSYADQRKELRAHTRLRICVHAVDADGGSRGEFRLHQGAYTRGKDDLR